MQYLPRLIRLYNGTVSRLFFDEGGEVSGRVQARTLTLACFS